MFIASLISDSVCVLVYYTDLFWSGCGRWSKRNVDIGLSCSIVQLWTYHKLSWQHGMVCFTCSERTTQRSMKMLSNILMLSSLNQSVNSSKRQASSSWIARRISITVFPMLHPSIVMTITARYQSQGGHGRSDSSYIVN